MVGPAIIAMFRVIGVVKVRDDGASSDGPPRTKMAGIPDPETQKPKVTLRSWLDFSKVLLNLLKIIDWLNDYL